MKTDNGLIKNRCHMHYENEDIIYASEVLDYIITSNEGTGHYYCYGNQKLDLIPFLVPGLTSRTSVEIGEFLLTSDKFKNIIDLFYIESEELYYLLRIIDNTAKKNNETVFIFKYQEDMYKFNNVLMSLSISLKRSYLELNSKKIKGE